MSESFDGEGGEFLLSWEITVPLLTDPYLMGLLVKVFGLSIGLVLVFIMVITRNFTIIEILKIGGMVGSFIGI
ncbi:hypothetical protein GF319_06185, partial [Candidatus Bathyarchaeota archaeon]|nr:hypothetical protein [Candidatus Bathyarchaeota archaeon]